MNNDFELELDELYKLVEKEYNEELEPEECSYYIELVRCLKENNIEIPFEIKY